MATGVPTATVAPLRGVSMRDSSLMSVCCAQPPTHPVRLLRGERGRLDVDDPLAGRDVPVQPRHDDPGREAVRHRQRLAVHADRDHGVAAVHHDRGRGTDRHAVVRGHQQLVRAVVHAGLTQHVRQSRAEEPRVADQVAADVVRDAAQRDPALDQRPREQLVVGQRDLAIDHAVDAQRPVLRVRSAGRPARCRSGRTAEFGVCHGVAALAEVGARRQRRRGLARRGQRELRAGARDVEVPVLLGAPDHAGERGHAGRRDAALQEPAPVGEPEASGLARRGRRPDRPDQPGQSRAARRSRRGSRERRPSCGGRARCRAQ